MQKGAATLLSPTVVHCPLSSAQSDRGEYRTEDGLVKGHAYSVTGTHKVRNPQGGLLDPDVSRLPQGPPRTAAFGHQPCAFQRNILEGRKEKELKSFANNIYSQP